MPLNPTVLIFGKLTIGLLWIVTGSTFFIASESTLVEAGRLTFIITAVAHVIECGIFFPTLNEKRPGATRGLVENLVLTLIFGVFHYATLKFEELAEETGDPNSRFPSP